MRISRVSSEVAPLALLLLADPSVHHIRSYLPGSTVFVGDEGQRPVAVAVLKMSQCDAELWNLAVAGHRQRCGLGRTLLAHAVRWARESGARRLHVGTGNSSFGPMAFYQKYGFRMVEVTRDFFAGYEPPIVENGIPCRDMVLFSLDIETKNTSDPVC
jgi:ribosomal protein S18 acetylase RimI-like enzyme